MTETLCAKGDVQLKAGSNAPTLTDAQYTSLINQAEAFLSTVARYDWVTNYASLSTFAKSFLLDAASSYAAFHAAKYTISNFPLIADAQTVMNANYNDFVEAANLLRDDNFKSFLTKGSLN